MHAIRINTVILYARLINIELLFMGHYSYIAVTMSIPS